MSPSLNIAALTKRTGVAPDTIRKWEQRYGVLRPERTAGGQRRYSEVDVARVEWLKARLQEGYRIGEAAALLGSGEVVTLAADELRKAIVEATRRSDVEALARLVDQALALPTLQEAFCDVLAPALRSIGDLWHDGEVDVGQEHLTTGAVRSALQKLLADARAGVRGVAVLACAPGEQHEIGLLMLAVLLRADGWQVGYLGPDTPLADAVALAVRLRANALCLSASTAERFADLEHGLDSAHVPRDMLVVVGGRATAGPGLRDAVDTLRVRAA